MAQEQLFSFFNKLRSQRLTDGAFYTLSALSENTRLQSPVLNANISEFYDLWTKRKKTPLSFFFGEAQKSRCEIFLNEYVAALESTQKLSIFVALGLIRHQSKRTGPALLIPATLDTKTHDILPAGNPIENPLLAESENFPEPDFENTQPNNAFKDYLTKLQTFYETQSEWKLADKGICLLLLPSDSFYSLIRASRIYRRLEQPEIQELASYFLGEKEFPISESAFDAVQFRKTFHPADYAFLYPTDAEDTDATISALNTEAPLFILQSQPGSQPGKVAANLIAESVIRHKNTVLLASRPTSLLATKDAFDPPYGATGDDSESTETIENKLRETRRVLESYYKAVHPGQENNELSEILEELEAAKKIRPLKFSQDIAEKMQGLSLHECQKVRKNLNLFATFHADSNYEKTHRAFSFLSDNFFKANQNETLLRTIVSLQEKIDSVKDIVSLLKRSALLSEQATLADSCRLLEILQSQMRQYALDFPNWNLRSADWETFKDSLLAFPSAGKIWSDFRNQGGMEYTPEALDINIWQAKETFADLSKTRMKNLSDTYLSAKKLLRSTLRNHKIAKTDDDLLKYAETLQKIQDSRAAYKSGAALANRLFGSDWNYEKTNWSLLEKKIKKFYAIRESKPEELQLHVLEQMYLFRDELQAIESLQAFLLAYETQTSSLKELLSEEFFKQSLAAQWDILQNIQAFNPLLSSYIKVKTAVQFLKEKGLEKLTADSFLEKFESLQTETDEQKVLNQPGNAVMAFWVADYVRHLTKENPDLFTKSPKERIRESKAYRAARDAWHRINFSRTKKILQENPNLVKFYSTKRLSHLSPCDTLIILDAETISVSDFFFFALKAKKIIFIGDINLPTIEQDPVLPYLLRLGAPYRTLTFAYGCKHPNILKFLSEHFYNNEIRYLAQPDSSKDRTFKQTIAKEPLEKLLKAIFTHAENNPARSLGVLVFSEDSVSALRQKFKAALNQHPKVFPFFKDRGYRNTFYIATPETAIGKSRDTVFAYFTPTATLGGETANKLIACLTETERELHLFLPETMPEFPSEAGKKFTALCERAANPKISIESEEGNSKQKNSPILKELKTFADSESLRSAVFYGHPQAGIGLVVGDENNPNRYLLGVEDDSFSSSLRADLDDCEYIRPKCEELLGWKIIRIWTPVWYLYTNDEKNHFLATTKIEQSIAPTLSETPIDGDSKDDSETSLLVLPYKKIHPKIAGTPHDKPIPELSLKALLYQLRFYVEMESPIHEDILIKRILELHGVAKPGPKILQILKDALHDALKQKLFIKTGAFFYSATPKEVTLRYRGELPESERSLQYVPPEERALLQSDETAVKETLGLL